MKKKIKDLTEEEAKTICDKSLFCYKCPLNGSYKCVHSHVNDEREVDE